MMSNELYIAAYLAACLILVVVGMVIEWKQKK
jgi:hypothetical protein